jgi:hypothetical protein
MSCFNATGKRCTPDCGFTYCIWEMEEKMNTLNDIQKKEAEALIDILKNDGFFEKPMPNGKHWRVALALDDVHFGCCFFVDEKAKNDFLNHYSQLAKITGKKWGCAVVECEI